MDNQLPHPSESASDSSRQNLEKKPSSAPAPQSSSPNTIPSGKKKKKLDNLDGMEVIVECTSTAEEIKQTRTRIFDMLFKKLEASEKKTTGER